LQWAMKSATLNESAIQEPVFIPLGRTPRHEKTRRGAVILRAKGPRSLERR